MNRAGGASSTAGADLHFASRCASGDRAAQRQLFDREVDRVHAILYRILGPTRDLEDLVQEVFLEVFRSIASYRGEAQLATWMARVTARVAYGYLAGKRRAPVLLESIPDPAAPGPSAERQTLARHAAHRLYEILGDLDARLRLAFALHVLDGRSLEEVADLMDSSLVATKSRVFRVRRQLRRDPVVADLLASLSEDES